MNGRMMNRIGRGILASALVVAGLFWGGVAAAQTTGDDGPTAGVPGGEDGQGTPAGERSLRDKVAYMLSGYHFSPSRDDLDELADSARIQKTLRTIAKDSEVRPSVRMRSVDVLALYANDDNRAFFKELADEPSDDLSDKEARVARLIRHHAITGLAKITEPSTAVSLIGKYLESDDIQVQLTVVAALGNHAGQPGAERLKSFAKSVEDEVVREELAEYVSVPDSKPSK